MSKDTEKVLRDLKQYLSDKEMNSEEDFEKQVGEFMNMVNVSTDTPKRKGKDAWDYLDMAYEADSPQDALKHAKKALQLDKNCLDAEVMIAELTTDNPEKLKLKYEELIVKAEEHLKKEDLLIDETIGRFWGILETRPYMRLRHTYINHLLQLGKFRKSIKECEELLLLSEGDNLGVRYTLVALYAFFEDEINAMKLYKKYEEQRPHMLLPIVALYYKLDNYKKAESYLNKLNAANSSLKEVFDDGGMIVDDAEIDDMIDSGMYRAGSKEEIMIAMADSAFLYATTQGLLLWIADHCSS